MANAKYELNFLEFLQNFRRGELLTEGDEKMDELMTAIHKTGNGGEFTMKIKFKNNKAGQLEIDPSVTIKRPTRPLGTGIYFLTDEGRLTRRDPRQMDIEDEIERRRTGDVN